MSDLLTEVRDGRLPPPSVARAIRLAAGVSQPRMAEELGVHRVSVARWECGTRRPRGDVRAAYGRLLRELQEAVGK